MKQNTISTKIKFIGILFIVLMMSNEVLNWAVEL